MRLRKKKKWKDSVKDNYQIEVLNYWNDQDDLYTEYLIKKDEQKAKIIDLIDTNDLECNYSTSSDEEITNSLLKQFKSIDLTKYIFNMPKLSDCHEITKKIFKDLYNSENNMLFLEEEYDFDNYDINENVLKELNDDIKKYNLKDYFDIFDDHIVVYGGLQCCFNIDLEERNNELER